MSGILGVGSSIIYEIICIILKRKNVRKEDDITSRIKDVSTVLEKSVQELGELLTELEERMKKVEKIKEEAEQAETIISLTEEQIKTVRITLNSVL